MYSNSSDTGRSWPTHSSLESTAVTSSAVSPFSSPKKKKSKPALPQIITVPAQATSISVKGGSGLAVLLIKGHPSLQSNFPSPLCGQQQLGQSSHARRLSLKGEGTSLSKQNAKYPHPMECSTLAGTQDSSFGVAIFITTLSKGLLGPEAPGPRLFGHRTRGAQILVFPQASLCYMAPRQLSFSIRISTSALVTSGPSLHWGYGKSSQSNSLGRPVKKLSFLLIRVDYVLLQIFSPFFFRYESSCWHI